MPAPIPALAPVTTIVLFGICVLLYREDARSYYDRTASHAKANVRISPSFFSQLVNA
jgi:hypothetical protein